MFDPLHQTVDSADEGPLVTNEPFPDCTQKIENDPFRSAEHWQYAMTKVRDQIYNSTMASLPSPHSHITYYERQHRPSTDSASLLPIRDSYHDFNSKPLVKDIEAYRRQRSENLLKRVVHWLDMDQSSVIRLFKGVFVAQQSQPISSQLPSELLRDGLAEHASLMTDAFVEAPVNTFYFEDFINTIHLQTDILSTGTELFLPFSYTFGARYTDIYSARKDILIRGSIPLWCQLLFLSECTAQVPIQPNETRAGLFFFAPQVFVTFRPFSVESSRDKSHNLDWILAYEYNAMELGGPEAQTQMGSYPTGAAWTESKKRTLEQILCCDIPENDARLITELATQWATSQGLCL